MSAVAPAVSAPMKKVSQAVQLDEIVQPIIEKLPVCCKSCASVVNTQYFVANFTASTQLKFTPNVETRVEGLVGTVLPTIDTHLQCLLMAAHMKKLKERFQPYKHGTVAEPRLSFSLYNGKLAISLC